ncbi:MAG: potassium channel protein [Candidatus Dormibacteraeota bacterium]|nr:potassium channel protein [Candidatus Dormibacteraeota bacterium]
MIDRNPLQRFRLVALLLVAILTVGTVGYRLIEGWTWLDSVFMTVITVTTVGYGEVHPFDAAGKVFTSVVIAGGVGTVLYTFGVVGEVIGGGHLAAYRKRRSVERDLNRLSDHVIVCAYGRVGSQIVLELERDGVAVVVVENNPGPLARVAAAGKLHVAADATSRESLERAGISRARALVTAVDSDEKNVYITLTARSLNPGLFIVARAGEAQSVERLKQAGANRVVSPYRMAALRMADVTQRPAVVDALDSVRHGSSDFGIDEILVPSESPLVGVAGGLATLERDTGAHVLALRRLAGQLFTGPGAEVEVEAEDLLVLLGTRAELQSAAARVAGHAQPKR